MLKLQDLHRLADCSDEEEFDSRDCGIEQRKEVVIIRKDNRNNLFKKRRLITRQPLQPSCQQQDELKVDPVIMSKVIPRQAYILLNRVFLPSELDELIDKIKSEQVLEKLQGAIGLRILLSSAEAPIEKVIQSGAVDEMIRLLTKPQWPEIQFQSAWALADIASGNQQHSQYLTDRNCINIFYQLIQSGLQHLIWPCVWFFGNIACDTTAQRDVILRAGTMEIIVNVLQKYKKDEFVVTDIVWAIRNLCRGEPLPEYSLVQTAIQSIAQAMAEGIFNSEPPFRQCLWAISCHSDKKQGKVVMSNNLYLKIVEIVNEHQRKRLIFPCLRIIRDLLAFPRNVGKIIEAGVLDGLIRALSHKNIYICMEACSGLCNILKSKNEDYVLQVLNRQHAIKLMKEMLFCDSERMRLDIAVSFCMMCECNNLEMDLKLIKLDILADFSRLLGSHNPQIIIEMLKALEIPLMLSAQQSEKRKSQNIIAVELNRVGIASAIERLQYHINQEIYKHASRLLETYFILEEIDQPQKTKQSKKERRRTCKSEMLQKKAEYLSTLQ